MANENNKNGTTATAKKSGNNHKNNRRSKPKEALKILPLGGLKEIGKNCTVIEYKNEILIIDCGFSFPEDEMFGIDVVIPDFTYLKNNMQKIKGLILTHGHEDHIGGIPYLLKELNVPIYGTAMTIGLVKNKLAEYRLNADLNVIKSGDIFKIGGFKIEAIRTNHSIADPLAYSIKCQGGHIVHTGDFKIDYTPRYGKTIDLGRFAELGNEGVDVLMCDSTNVLRPGYTPSEQVVASSMNRIFEETDKRIIIATFSSNVYRIKDFMEASIKYGRKIAVSGRSMENVIKLAQELGYLDVPKSVFVDIRKINNIPDSSLTIITTGSQGEPMAALTRMATDNHKAVKLKKGDVIIFSSSPIPGNEKTVTNVVNKLYEKNVKVILSDLVDIHVSGHACREELKLIHTLIKPRYFIPVHGEYRHLIEHAKLAKNLGLSNGNVFVMSNGDELIIRGKNANLVKDYISAEAVLVDGYGIGDIGSVVLRDRKQLSNAGIVMVAVTLNRDSQTVIARPELITRGFIYVKENGPLINEATNIAIKSLEKCEKNNTMDMNSLKNVLRDDMRLFMYKKTKKNPVILPVILYI